MPDSDPSRSLSSRLKFRGARRFLQRATARGSRVLVAWSGGADSTFVLEALLAARQCNGSLDISAAHIHHGLRGSSAEADLEHCRERARSWDLRLEVARLSAPKDAGETWARTARYAALEKIATATGSEAILTGHHRDDQIETLLWQLLRGVRPSRARGMRVARRLSPTSDVFLVRPALGLDPRIMLRWLSERGSHFCADETNFDPDHNPRNALRHRVIPLLDAIAPPGWKRRWMRFFLRDARHAAATERSVETGLLSILLAGAGLAPTQKRRLALRQALNSSDAQILLGTRFGVRIERQGDHVQVVHGAESPAVFATPVPRGGSYHAPPGTLHLEPVSAADAAAVPPAAERAYLVLPKYQSCCWRNANPEERLWQRGVAAPRRLRGLLAGRGWNARRRAEASVLAVGGAVAWLVGVEVDRRFAWSSGQRLDPDQQLFAARFEPRRREP